MSLIKIFTTKTFLLMFLLLTRFGLQMTRDGRERIFSEMDAYIIYRETQTLTHCAPQKVECDRKTFNNLILFNLRALYIHYK